MTFILVLICTVPMMSAARQQPKVVDSLTFLLEGKTAAEQHRILRRLIVKYVDHDNDKALELAEKATVIALASQDSLLIVRSGLLKAQILHRLNRIGETIALLVPLLKHRKYSHEMMAIMNVLGIAHIRLGSFDRALDFYFQAVDLARINGDSSILARGLNNMGITYYKLKDYGKALPLLLEGYSVARRIGKVDALHPINISLCYTHLKDYGKARKYLMESFAFCRPQCSRLTSTHIQYAQGCIYLGEGNLDSAQTSFVRSLHFARSEDDPRMQLDNIYLIAEILIQRNQFSSAEKLLQEGETVIKEGIPFNMEKIKVYSRLAELYLTLKNFEQAAYYQSQYIILKDSVYNESLTTNLMKVESEHLERENHARISAQKEIIYLKQQAIDRQVRINFLTAAFGVLMAVFAFFLYRNFRLKQSLNRILDQKVKQRTYELERKQNELVTALNEKEIVICRISQCITETVNTLSGLSATLKKDSAAQSVTWEFGQKIDKTCQRLKRYLLFGEGDRVAIT